MKQSTKFIKPSTPKQTPNTENLQPDDSNTNINDPSNTPLSDSIDETQPVNTSPTLPPAQVEANTFVES